MVYVMNRYQIYLDPKSVNIFDRVAIELGSSRSHIIQDCFDRIAREFEKVLTAKNSSKSKNNPLLKMSGIGKSNTPNLSQDVDSIYFQD